MAKEIELPDGSIGEFPDDMSDDAIRGVLRQKFAAPAPDPLKDTMRRQTAEGGIANAFNTGIANASTRVAAGIGSMLPKALAKHLPNQRDVDLLEAASEGSIPARTGQVAMDIVASAPAAFKVAKLAPAIAPLRASAAAAIAGETGVNASYGALTADEGQAGQGAAWGAGGTLVGHALGRTLGGLVKPTDEAQALMAQGIHPTVGQSMGGNSKLRKAEDWIAKMPVAGASVRNAREGAIKDFQQATRNLATPEGGSAATIESVTKSFEDAYSGLLHGVEISVPNQTAENLYLALRVEAQHTLSPAQQRAAKDTLDRTIGHTMSTGTISADAAHEAEIVLKKEAARFQRSPDPMQQSYGEFLRDAADKYRTTWRGALPEGQQKALSKVDRAYAEFSPIRKAATVGNSTLSTPENYTPTQLLQALRQGDRSMGKGNYLNSAQGKLAAAAQDVIGSAVPKPTEAGLAALLGGGGLATYLGHGGLAAVGSGAAFLGGTRPMQRFLTGQTALNNKAVIDALRRGATPLTTSARTSLTPRNDEQP